MQRRLHPLLPLAMVGVAWATTGCEHLPEIAQPPFESTTFHPSQGLDDRQPAEIAVAVVRNQSPAKDVPIDDLRAATVRELVDRLYTPLATDFVDGHWTEASFGGAAPPDSLLVMVITHWDANSLGSKGVLRAGAELRLFDGGSSSGPILWGVTANREIDLVPGQVGDAGLTRDRLPDAVDAFVEELLKLLPERDPLALERPAEAPQPR